MPAAGGGLCALGVQCLNRVSNVSTKGSSHPASKLDAASCFNNCNKTSLVSYIKVNKQNQFSCTSSKMSLIPRWQLYIQLQRLRKVQKMSPQTAKMPVHPTNQPVAKTFSQVVSQSALILLPPNTDTQTDHLKSTNFTPLIF